MFPGVQKGHLSRGDFLEKFDSLLVFQGKMGMGGLAAIVLLGGKVMAPIQKSLGFWMKFQEFYLAHGQVKDIFSLKHDRRGIDGKEFKFKKETNMPHVIVKMISGRSDELKTKLAEEITRVVMKATR